MISNQSLLLSTIVLNDYACLQVLLLLTHLPGKAAVW